MDINAYQNLHETKAHTTTDFPYNTYLCSIPQDFTEVPLHWHNELELIVIQRGHGLVSVDLHTESVSAGDVVLVLPGQLHSISQKESLQMKYENILFAPSMLLSDTEDLCSTRYIRPLLERSLLTDTFLTPALPCHPGVSGCIREIDRLCDIRPEGYQLAVRGLLFQVFFFLISSNSHSAAVSSAKTKSLEKMKTILKYVEEHYAEPISIEDMAALTFYSKSHFMKFFKTHMGTGFTEYLNDYRLMIAARLLTTTEDSILETAVQTGFDNLSYFNRLFKRKYGESPGKYRAARRANV